MNAAAQQEAPSGLVSIERVVAFVVGPAVTAVSGWLSLAVAKKWGISIAGPEIAGIFATGGLAAAALAYKWLHGKQIELHAKGEIEKIEAIPGVHEFMRVTLKDLEGLAQSAALHAVSGLTGGKAPPSTGDLSAASVADPGAASTQ